MIARFPAIATLVLSMLFAAQGQTRGVAIEPGMWQLKATITLSLMPGERSHESTQCIRQANMDPLQMMNGNQQCQVDDQTVSGDTVSWTMRCTTEMGTATGTGRFTSAGASATGEMHIEFDAGKQTIAMDTQWQGTRIGDC